MSGSQSGVNDKHRLASFCFPIGNVARTYKAINVPVTTMFPIFLGESTTWRKCRGKAGIASGTTCKQIRHYGLSSYRRSLTLRSRSGSSSPTPPSSRYSSSFMHAPGHGRTSGGSPTSHSRYPRCGSRLRCWPTRWRSRCCSPTACGSSMFQLPERPGHPLATPVNRNKQNPTNKVVFSSLPNLFSQPLSSPHTWFSIIGCAVAHQSPIRIKACAPRDAWPLAALAAPENLLFPPRPFNSK